VPWFVKLKGVKLEGIMLPTRVPWSKEKIVGLSSLFCVNSSILLTDTANWE